MLSWHDLSCVNTQRTQHSKLNGSRLLTTRPLYTRRAARSDDNSRRHVFVCRADRAPPGPEVGVVSAPAELPAGWPAAIQIAFHASPTPPTFENRYTPEGRKQILHTASQPITLAAIPPAWRAAPLIHLGPVLGEVPEQLVEAFPSALLGVTPQGWMRAWNEPLPGPVLYRPWAPAPRPAGADRRPGAEHRGCPRR